jgi:diguanylate cyclase (GGDEF)-like protein/PAS domain S-box-containing protein
MKNRSVFLLIVFVLIGLAFVGAIHYQTIPPVYALGLFLLLIPLLFFSEWWAGLFGTIAFISIYLFTNTNSQNRGVSLGDNTSQIFIIILLIIPFLILILWQQRRKQNDKELRVFSKQLQSILQDRVFSFEIWKHSINELYHVSETCYEITGYKAKDFQNDETLFEKIIHPDDLLIYHQYINNHHFVKPSIRFIHKDGTIKKLQPLKCPGALITQDHSVFHILFLDITDQENTRLTPSKIVHVFYQLFQNVEDMVWIQDHDPERIIYANHTFRIFFQYSTQKRYQNPYIYLEQIHPDDTDAVFTQLNTLKNNHRPVNFEYRVIQKQGLRIWIQVQMIPILDRQGNHILDVGIAKDITPDKKMAQDLLFANETLTQLANNIQELFWIRDRYTRDFIFVNPLFEQFFSTKAAEFHNDLSRYYDLIYEDDRIWVQKAEDNLFRNGKQFVGEYRFKLPDNSIRWVHTQAYPITNREGEFYRAVGITEDITSWKKNENEIKEFAHQQNIVANLQRAAIKHNELRPFLKDVFLAVSQLFKIKGCILFEYDRANKIFIVRESIGIPKNIDIPETHTINNKYLPGFAMIASDIVFSSDLTNEQRFHLPEFLNQAGFNSCICARIPAMEYNFGVFSIFCEQKQIFSETQINLLHSIASLISEFLLRYQAEQALIASEKQYRELIELQNTGILILNHEGLIRYANPAAEELFDTPKEFLIGYTIWSLLEAENTHLYHNQHEKIVNGGETTFEIHLNKIPDFPKDVMVTAISRLNEKGELIEYINLIRDITQQKKEEDELVHLTMYDPLTGIFNRSYYENEIFRLEITDYYPISILICDVDGLKLTNDKYGHSMGDKLLVQVSTILKSAFRPSDVIARIGGDEFAVLMTNTNNRMMKQMMDRIQNKIDQANKQMGFPNEISISIGGATSLKKNTLRSAIQKADMRMYQQKRNKKTRTRT